MGNTLRRGRASAGGLLSALLVAWAAPVAATPGVGTLQTLSTFTAANGCLPQTALVQGRDGYLYGTTEAGGADSLGTIYKVSPSGTLTVLYSFNGLIGEHPSSALIQDSSGNFYGSLQDYGTVASGAIFKMTPSGALSVLASGVYSNAPLTQGGDGNFYGVGVSNDNGIVFQLTPAGAVTTLATFSDNGGKAPNGPLMQDATGNLYGTTASGGADGDGMVFEVARSGNVTTLVSFDGANGQTPYPLAAGGDGNFYGTTQQGGANLYGTAFRVTPGGTLTTLASFTQTTGSPTAGLVLGGDGNFYGAATQGLFQLTPGGTLTLLVASQTSRAPMIAGSDGNLYGSQSPADLVSSCGNLFRLTTGGAYSVLTRFSYQNGARPDGPLLQGVDGNLYGVTTGYGYVSPDGSNSNALTIFRVTPAGVLTTLVALPRLPTTGVPASVPALVQSNGNFYGVTNYGGSSNAGTAFELTPSGMLTNLADFTSSSGLYPTGLTLGNDGNFYGATELGGANGLGAVFKLTPSGTLTDIASFNASFDTYNSVSQLLLATDGAFYGTAPGGNGANDGQAFRVTSSGALTLLASFSGSSTGSYPFGGLVQGTDGNLYGITAGGGPSGGGIFFQLSLSGTLTPLYNFDSYNFYGGAMEAPLVLGMDGDFYTTTASGSALGAIIKLSSTTSPTALITFPASGVDGIGPRNLLLASDGNFYGTTLQGGGVAGANAGTVFRYAQPPAAPTRLTAAAGSSSVNLSWNAVSGATRYNVYQGTIAGGEMSAPVTTVLSNSVSLGGLTTGQIYYFTVTTVSGNGESVYSNEASAAVPAGATGVSSSGGGGGAFGRSALLFLLLGAAARKRH